MKIFKVCNTNYLTGTKHPAMAGVRNPFKKNKNDEKDSFIRQTPEVQETEFGVIKHLENGKIDELVFHKPVSLKMAFEIVNKANDKYSICHNGSLTRIRLNRLDDHDFLDYFGKMKFTKFVGAGSKVYAFENKDGNVLKISEVPHFDLRDNMEDFDAKILERGDIDGKYYYYIQEKCDKKDITKKDLDNMEKKIESKGYNVVDMGLSQIGRNKEGKICLIDYECAVPIEGDWEGQLVYF